MFCLPAHTYSVKHASYKKLLSAKALYIILLPRMTACAASSIISDSGPASMNERETMNTITYDQNIHAEETGNT